MSCWGLVLGCLFICSPSVGQLARESHSASSCSTRLPPSLAAWLRDAVVPGEHGARPATSFAEASGRKVSGGKRHFPRRAGIELHPQILVLGLQGQEPHDRNGESGDSRNHMHQLCLQLCST